MTLGGFIIIFLLLLAFVFFLAIVGIISDLLFHYIFVGIPKKKKKEVDEDDFC